MSTERDPRTAGDGAPVESSHVSLLQKIATVLLVVAVTAVAAVAAGGGCAAAKQARRAHLARVDLAGLSRADLEACAGEPLRIEKAPNGWQYLKYESPLRPDQERSTQCVATFVVKNGYVEDLEYENPSGGLIGDSIIECLPIVDPCLPK